MTEPSSPSTDASKGVSRVRDEQRLRALYNTGLLDTPPEEAFDRLTRLAQRLLGVPVVLISLVDADRQFFKSAQGVAESWASRRATPLSHSFCQHVVATNAPFLVEDAHRHPLVADNGAVEDLNVIAYLGVPLLTTDGHPIGSLCAIDHTPHTWSPDEQSVLSDLAGAVMTEIALRQKVREQEALLGQLHRLNMALEEQVETGQSTLQRTAASLENAHRALAQRSRELQDFAYVASHDLQEPLRKVHAFADLLESEHSAALSDEARFYIQRMQHASERMSQLIRDLLALSRVMTNGMPFEVVHLDAVLASVLHDLRERIEEKRAEIASGPLPKLDADPVQMHQLLYHLLDNAIKFHRPGMPPRIEVHAAPSDDATTCRIVVADLGIGFDPRHAERIFIPFQHLHRRGEYEGTGIGLALVRRIAERHGGQVTAQGRPGHGSRFILTLPVHHTPSPARPGTDP